MTPDELNGVWYVAVYFVRETMKAMSRQPRGKEYEWSNAAILLHSFLEDSEETTDDDTDIN